MSFKIVKACALIIKTAKNQPVSEVYLTDKFELPNTDVELRTDLRKALEAFMLKEYGLNLQYQFVLFSDFAETEASVYIIRAYEMPDPRPKGLTAYSLEAVPDEIPYWVEEALNVLTNETPHDYRKVSEQSGH